MVKVAGGVKIQKALGDIAEKMKKAKQVEVGFFEDKTYPDGTGVAFVAAMNEWGSKGFFARRHAQKYATQKGGEAPPERTGRPPRPFFRGMVNAKSKEWGPAIAGLLKSNDYDADKTLAQMGEAIAGQLEESIVEYVGPPLAAATIAEKGFDKQLIDTSVMVKSVSYKVKS